LGLTVIDDLPEMIGWVKGLFDFFPSSLVFFWKVFSFSFQKLCDTNQITVWFNFQKELFGKASSGSSTSAW